MEILSARVNSFKKTKRVKNPNKPSSSVTLKWPHPKDFRANPATLAEAGFFYDPSYDDDDNATCYMCGKELAGWEDDDDPFTIHWTKCGQTCCWASVRCGLAADVDHTGRFISSDKTRVPTHKSMEAARQGTFKAGDGWIHDKVKNHGASSKMMAKAGFVYTPQEAGDDLATCLYCSVSLSGWDEDDDPLEEHRRRSAKFDIPCAFFNASQPPKPASKAQSKPASSRSTSKSKHQDIVMPTKNYDGEDDDEAESSAAEPPTAIGKTPRRPRTTSSTAKTPKPSSRSSSRSALKNIVEEDTEDQEEEIEPPATVKKKGRSASKSATKASDLEAEPPATVKKKAARSRSKSVARGEPDEAVEDEAPATVKKKRTTSKSKAASKSDLEVEGDVEAAPPATVKKKRVPSKSKAAPKTEPETDEDLPVEATVKKRTTSRSKAVPKADQDMQLDNAEEELETRKAKPSRTISKSKQVTPSEVDTEDEPPRKSSRTKPKETKAATQKPASRSKAAAKPGSENDMFDSDSDLEEPKSVKKAKAPRTTSKSKPEAQTLAPISKPASELDSEADNDSPAEPEPQAPIATTQKTKQKLQTMSSSNSNIKVLQMPHNIEAKDLFNEDLVEQASTTTPSVVSSPSPTPGAAQNIMSDLPPLFVPKRNEAPKPPPKSSLATNPLIEMQMKKKKSLAPRKSSKPPNMATATTATLAPSDSSRTIPASSSSSSTFGQMAPPKQATVDQVQPMTSVQPVRQKMKVVEISSDEEDVEEELVREKGKQKEDSRQPQPAVKKAPSLQEPPKTERGRSKKSVEAEAVQPAPVARPVSPPRAKSPTSGHKRQDDDVIMGADESKADVKMDTIQVPDPSTPPRYKSHDTPPRQAAAAANTSSSSLRGAVPAPRQDTVHSSAAAEPPVVPALSRLPFTPLQSLSEAELDMTVEEWIRYQMEVEYDKFRRDGERELQRFRKQAEEVRKAIESL